eukprot:m.4879 g.4879  ORF g.4879 m.4879 type:complete len:243 (+) comp11463_c0_seq1:54-782(+)
MAADGDWFSRLVLYFLPQNCFEEYFVKFNFFDGPCFNILLSRGLGMGIVLGSVLVKLPQMVKIVRQSSVIGLSLVAFFLELIAVTFTMSYNAVNGYPFSTWGESFFISIQCAILVAMFLYYTGRPIVSMGFLLVYAAVACGLSFGFVPVDLLTSLQVTTIPVMMASKAFQIWENYKNGSTGQLSAITTVMNLTGTLGRIFTTLQEVGDSLILLSFTISTALNAILVFQMVYYWNVKKSDKKD